MSWYAAAAVLVGIVVVFMAMGMPVAYAFFATNIVGVFLFMGGAAGLAQIIDNSTAILVATPIAAVPLFLLKGDLFFNTGLAGLTFDAIDRLFGKVKGRLSYVAVTGGTVFATLTGSSMANTAIMGSMLVPDMIRRGYAPHMAMGPILAAGGLAALVPSSAMLVLLGSVARLDIGKLLVAGIVPSVILALMYIFTIYVKVRRNPAVAPAYEVESFSAWQKCSLFATRVLPMLIVILIVTAVILFGIGTPSEAGAFGVLGTLIVAAAYRCLTWSAIRKSLMSTTRVTGMILLILMASSSFSQLLAISGASSGLVEQAAGMQGSKVFVFLLMFIVIIVLGCFVDSISIMLLTVPIFFPIAQTLGFDLIWFGLLIMIGIEMGFTTPPFGLLLFVMKGVAPPGTTMGQVIASQMPYLGCQFLLVGLLWFFPVLVLLLPNLFQ